MITNSVLKIYSDKFLHNLTETVNVSGSELKGRTTSLLPGKSYWATVSVTDSVVGTSPDSLPYKFWSLPDIVLSGTVTVSFNSFTRPTTITTNNLTVVDHGFQVTTDQYWHTRPTIVSGNVVTDLEENTVYYYRPWVKDEYGRTYVNTGDVDTVRTSFSVPKVKITAMYGSTDTTFSGRVEVESSIAVSSVTAYYTTGGVTLQKNLTAGTGGQDFTLENLSPATK